MYTFWLDVLTLSMVGEEAAWTRGGLGKVMGRIATWGSAEEGSGYSRIDGEHWVEDCRWYGKKVRRRTTQDGGGI
jgi:hypothetical protein